MRHDNMQGFKYFIALSENTISQELKKLNPDEVKKNQSEAESIYKSIFNFNMDPKKQKEIINWITYFLPSHRDIKNKMNQNRDFLYTNYDKINFKTNEYTPDTLDADSQEYHDNLGKNTKIGSKGAYGKPIVTFPNGWKWVSIEKGYCPIEGQAMGHCGNVAGEYNDKHNIISLRNPQNVPYLTFIDEGDGVLGEMKGRFNNKPEEKFHPYIAELLLSPTIKKIKGGGYAPENNFELTDLNDQLFNKVLQQKPNLLYSPMEILKSMEDDSNYNSNEMNKMFVNALVQNNMLNSNAKLTSTLDINPKIEDHLETIMQHDPIIVAAVLLRHNFKLHKQFKNYLVEKYKDMPPTIKGGGYEPDLTQLNDLVLIYKKDIELFDNLFKHLSNNQKSDFVLRAILFKQKLSDKLYEYLNEDDAIKLKQAIEGQNLKVPPAVTKIIQRYENLKDFEKYNDARYKTGMINGIDYIKNKLLGQKHIDPYSADQTELTPDKLNYKLITKERLIKNLKSFLDFASLQDSSEAEADMLEKELEKHGLGFYDMFSSHWRRQAIADFIANDLSGFYHGKETGVYNQINSPFNIMALLANYMVYKHKTPDVTAYLLKLADYASNKLKNSKNSEDKKILRKIQSFVDDLKFIHLDT